MKNEDNIVISEETARDIEKVLTLFLDEQASKANVRQQNGMNYGELGVCSSVVALLKKRFRELTPKETQQTKEDTRGVERMSRS